MNPFQLDPLATLALTNAPPKTNDEIMDPDTAEDPDSVKVATEIVANLALAKLSNPASNVGSFASDTVKNGLSILDKLVTNMSRLEPKVLAKVVQTTARPYQLSDFGWLHVLKSVATRRQINTTPVRDQVESMQGYLEPKLSQELKSKLRTRFPTPIYDNTTVSRDAETGRLTTITEIVGKAFMIREVIRVSMGEMMQDPKAEAKAITAAIETVAKRLQQLDETFGIVGVFAHASLQRLAVTDLSSPMILFIIPMLKATGDAPFKAFDWVYNIDGFRPQVEIKADQTQEQRILSVREYKREDFLKEARAVTVGGNIYGGDSFFRKAKDAGFVQTDELGDYVESEKDDGTRIRIRPRPDVQTQPQGVELPKVGLDAFEKPTVSSGIVAGKGYGVKSIPFNDDTAGALQKRVADDEAELQKTLELAKSEGPKFLKPIQGAVELSSEDAEKLSKVLDEIASKSKSPKPTEE